MRLYRPWLIVIGVLGYRLRAPDPDAVRTVAAFAVVVAASSAFGEDRFKEALEMVRNAVRSDGSREPTPSTPAENGNGAASAPDGTARAERGGVERAA